MPSRRFVTDLRYSDVTPEPIFLNRRKLLSGLAAAGLGAGIGAGPGAALAAPEGLDPNSFEEITTYNNFYEFGTGKDEPAKYAPAMETSPWTVQIGGMVDRPGAYWVEDILKDVTTEERIYRFRCVEAWSMVIPWVGFPLAQLLEKVGVQPGAKYVSFQTAMLPDVMVGLRSPVLEWPYREGLRLDEAMHPLTLIATGLYGKELPEQNGAPLRLVVPWKYGFKSIKSLVSIELTEEQPKTSWNMSNPREYGFYSNVNPEVDHPRWSQATERRIGGGFFAKRIETPMFNGYAEEVAGLYDGMDLKKQF
jgi:sulfoxide reductase catalytic subunit YedY